MVALERSDQAHHSHQGRQPWAAEVSTGFAAWALKARDKQADKEALGPLFLSHYSESGRLTLPVTVGLTFLLAQLRFLGFCCLWSGVDLIVLAFALNRGLNITRWRGSSAGVIQVLNVTQLNYWPWRSCHWLRFAWVRISPVETDRVKVLWKPE